MKLILIKDIEITYVSFWILLDLMFNIDINKYIVKKFSRKVIGINIKFINSSFGVLTANHKLFKISISF